MSDDGEKPPDPTVLYVWPDGVLRDTPPPEPADDTLLGHVSKGARDGAIVGALAGGVLGKGAVQVGLGILVGAEVGAELGVAYHFLHKYFMPADSDLTGGGGYAGPRSNPATNEATPSDSDLTGGAGGPLGPRSTGAYASLGREATPNLEGTGGSGPLGPRGRGSYGSSGRDVTPNLGGTGGTGPIGPR